MRYFPFFRKGTAMKIIEAINRADQLKPNTYTQEEKVRWLSNLDTLIFNTVISNHEDAEIEEFSGYDENTDIEGTELLAPSPYDEMYIHWINSKIDLHNGEYTKYNNDVSVYNDYMSSFKNWYNRRHKPKGEKIKFW